MIVVVDSDDQAIGDELRGRLESGSWPQFSSEIVSIDGVPGGLSYAVSEPAILAVGSVLERLALLVASLRSITEHPIIAAAKGGTVSRIVQLMRVGATDVIDLSEPFDAQMKRILSDLQFQSHRHLEESRSYQALTRSQRRVASLLVTDLSENDIAQTLGLSYFTVHNHVKEIYRSFNVHSRLEFLNAVRAAHFNVAAKSPRA